MQDKKNGKKILKKKKKKTLAVAATSVVRSSVTNRQSGNQASRLNLLKANLAI